MDCKQCSRPASMPLCFPDARAFMITTPNCMTSDGKSSYEYRMEMMANADKIIRTERESVFGGIPPPKFPYSSNGTCLPELNQNDCNGRTCSITQVTSSGLGMGHRDNVKPITTMSYYPINGSGASGGYSEANSAVSFN